MSEAPSPNNSIVGTHIRIGLLKEGSYFVLLPMHDDLLRLIGLVPMHWGAFENQLDSVIKALLLASGREENGWERRNFKKRKELLVDLVRSVVEPDHPEAAAQYRQLMANAADLHWRRNLVIHGRYDVTFPPAGPDRPTFTAHGPHNGRSMVINIDVETLEKLWHNIAHVTGGMIHTISLYGTYQGWPVAYPDTQILQAYRESSRPGSPTFGTQQHLLQASDVIENTPQVQEGNEGE